MNKIDIRSKTIHARYLARYLHEHAVQNATNPSCHWDDSDFRTTILDTIDRLKDVLNDIEQALPPF